MPLLVKSTGLGMKQDLDCKEQIDATCIEREPATRSACCITLTFMCGMRWPSLAQEFLGPKNKNQIIFTDHNSTVYNTSKIQYYMHNVVMLADGFHDDS